MRRKHLCQAASYRIFERIARNAAGVGQNLPRTQHPTHQFHLARLPLQPPILSSHACPWCVRNSHASRFQRDVVCDESRIEAKPERISPQKALQCTLAFQSVGRSPALGLISLRYSAIASVPQTYTPSWSSDGTRMDAENSSIRPYRKTRFLQTGIGHFGVFSGQPLEPTDLPTRQGNNPRQRRLKLESVTVARGPTEHPCPQSAYPPTGFRPSWLDAGRPHRDCQPMESRNGGRPLQRDFTPANGPPPIAPDSADF